MRKTVDVQVTLNACGHYVAVVPGRRTPIIALSLMGIRQRIALGTTNSVSIRLHLDEKAQQEAARRAQTLPSPAS